LAELWKRIRDWFLWPGSAISRIDATTEATRELTSVIDSNTEMIINKLKMLGVIMGAIDDLKAQFDEATDAIVARIERILQGQDAAVVAALQPELDRLKALGKDDDVEPVPPVDDPDEPAEPPVVDNGGDNIPPVG
jgi:hypothetical protein